VLKGKLLFCLVPGNLEQQTTPKYFALTLLLKKLSSPSQQNTRTGEWAEEKNRKKRRESDEMTVTVLSFLFITASVPADY